MISAAFCWDAGGVFWVEVHGFLYSAWAERTLTLTFLPSKPLAVVMPLFLCTSRPPMEMVLPCGSLVRVVPAATMALMCRPETSAWMMGAVLVQAMSLEPAAIAWM